MHTGFINTSENIQWLKDTALRGVILPAEWADFQSAGIQGNEDSPHAVNLYKARVPLFTDDYFRVRFDNDGLFYCECAEYDGVTNKPKGGLSLLD